MCRALKVLCAARGREALGEMKRALVSVEYELVGGATDPSELADQVMSWRPDVVVAEASFGSSLDAARAAHPGILVVSVGEPAEGADVVVASLAEAREALPGAPRPGGPVR